MKGRKGKRREHRVPLSAAALDLLKGLPREEGNPFVFIGARPGQPITRTAFFDVMERMGREETTHGMRAAFRTWAGDETNVAREVCEAALAHKVGDAAEQSYARGSLFDRRRKLMAAWARWCATPVRAKGAGDVVVPIGGGRS
jgi:integrase